MKPEQYAAMHSIIGGIALPNPASVALHEKLGFEKVAHFKEVGRKKNRWIDVGYWELIVPHAEAGTLRPAVGTDEL
jgi:phosphinothricin acetyltransferase